MPPKISKKTLYKDSLFILLFNLKEKLMRTFTQKLACLLMVLLCCVNVQLKADELTVADGTSTSSYVPAYGLYADTKDAGAQSL